MTRAAVEALGLKLFAPEAPAAAVTAVLPPSGVDSGAIVKELKSRFAAVITNGQGEMKGQIFRIAHLGFFDYMDTISLVGALEQVAHALKWPGFQFGQALVAAQDVYATRPADAAAKQECACGRPVGHAMAAVAAR
jgi:aspartate aminotransferase-like enzyme